MASFVEDLMLILIFASILGLLVKRFRFPVIIGYIIAGIVLGFFGDGKLVFGTDAQFIHVLSDLGILLLMFSLGLEFGFRKLRAIGLLPLFVGFIGTLLTWFLSTQAARLAGFSVSTAVFLGAVLSVSSTTATLRTLEELGLRGKRFAERVVGVLLAEDVVAMFFVIFLPSFLQKSVPTVEVFRVFFTVAVSLFAWWLLGFVVAPRITRRISKIGGDEILLLFSFGFCLALASFFAKLESSAALGAFVMGSILADTREIRRIEGLVRSLRYVFAALFFVSFGMLTDLSASSNQVFTVFYLLCVLLFGKFLIHFFLHLISGESIKDSSLSAASLNNIGEFSFILVQMGLGVGILGKESFPLVASVAIFSIFLSPFSIRIARWLSEKLDGILPDLAKQRLTLYGEIIRTVTFGGFWNFSRSSGDTSGYFARIWCSIRDSLLEGFQRAARDTTSGTLDRLAPWDEYLVELTLSNESFLIGKSLAEAVIRERFGVNIVAVERDAGVFVSPDPSLRFYPEDRLLVYGSEANLVSFSHFCQEVASSLVPSAVGLHECDLGSIMVSAEHVFCGQTLRSLCFRKNYSATVLALVRSDVRMKNPSSELEIQAGDVLYMVAPRLVLASLRKGLI